VLGVGTLGVLLLNTAMQQQARRLEAQHQRIAALQARAQELRLDLDLRSDPTVLAIAARQLQLRPSRTVKFVRNAGVSARQQAAGRAHAG
jgi:hypothetical protein